MPHLSATDAAFLAIERRDEPSHFGTVMFFGPGPDGPLTYKVVRSIVEERLPLVPVARSVVFNPLGGLLRPSWVEARDFDLDDHVRRTLVPKGQWAGAVARFVAEAHSVVLDRRRPLWELWVIEGLPDGHVALYAKLHIALFDATGPQLVTAILDDERGEAVLTPTPSPPLADSPFDLVGRFLAPLTDQIRHAAGFPQRLTARTMGGLRNQLPRWMDTAAEMTRRIPEFDPIAPLLPSSNEREPDTDRALRAPRPSFNAPLTPRRAFSFDRLRIDDVFAVRHATKTSFNDVLVAVCAGALRRWLLDHEELPTTPTVAMVPLLVHGSKGRQDAVAAGMVIPLPTNVVDPLERLRRTHSALRLAKERHRAYPATVMLDMSMFAPASMAAMAGRLVNALPHRSYVSPGVNLAITNVPGPRHPVHLAGRPLVSSHPVQPITDLTPLQIGLQSGAHGVGIGAVACRDTTEDLDQLVAALPVELDELLQAARQQPVPPA